MIEPLGIKCQESRKTVCSCCNHYNIFVIACQQKLIGICHLDTNKQNVYVDIFKIGGAVVIIST